VTYHQGDGLAIRIENFSFAPPDMDLARGDKVTWISMDDVPHLIVSADKRFRPFPALDTGDHYTLSFDRPGTIPTSAHFIPG
jgi:plastocyanin